MRCSQWAWGKNVLVIDSITLTVTIWNFTGMRSFLKLLFLMNSLEPLISFFKGKLTRNSSLCIYIVTFRMVSLQLYSYSNIFSGYQEVGRGYIYLKQRLLTVHQIFIFFLLLAHRQAKCLSLFCISSHKKNMNGRNMCWLRAKAL